MRIGSVGRQAPEGGRRRGFGGMRWWILLLFAGYAAWSWFGNAKVDPYTGEKARYGATAEEEVQLGAQAFDPVTGGALGVVVGDDDFAEPVGHAGLGEEGAQGALQTVGAAQGGDDDGHVGDHESTSPTVRMAAPRACAWATMRASAAGVHPYFDGLSRTSWV